MATRTSLVVRAGIYTRISWDPDGQRAGVERQRADCEALCADRGWEIAHYFEDNDLSAYSGKRRPPTSACWRPSTSVVSTPL